MVMAYGKDILKRVDALVKDLKAKYTLYFSVAVYEEFKRKIGKDPDTGKDRAASVVLEEMMKHFNETTPEPKDKK
jgi:hypothetical protein